MRYALIVMLGAVCLVSCAGRTGTTQKKQSVRKTIATQTQTADRYGYRIIKSYPHDTGSYTQGLFWHDGMLYESTGEYGYSSLRKVDLETGHTLKLTSLEEEFFGEGAALLNGKIYQLTWLEGSAFVYDADTFEATGMFNYPGEGWGLTTDGQKLYMSDGTPNISILNPDTFSVERTILVKNGDRPLQEINELEWIDGKIWANIYLTEKIAIINPETGQVEAMIDFSGISSHLNRSRNTDVMNGIAYDENTNRIFVTGKRWDKLFEIEIYKK